MHDRNVYMYINDRLQIIHQVAVFEYIQAAVNVWYTGSATVSQRNQFETLPLPRLIPQHETIIPQFLLYPNGKRRRDTLVRQACSPRSPRPPRDASPTQNSLADSNGRSSPTARAVVVKMPTARKCRVVYLVLHKFARWCQRRCGVVELALRGSESRPLLLLVGFVASRAVTKSE